MAPGTRCRAWCITPTEPEQYASADYRRELAAHGMVCSMSRKGDCWDAVAGLVLFGDGVFLSDEASGSGYTSTCAITQRRPRSVTLFDGKIVFRPIETPAGPRFQLEGTASPGRLLGVEDAGVPNGVSPGGQPVW